MEEKQIKVVIGIYDSDLPITTEEEGKTIPRPEETHSIYVPYNVPEDYLKAKVQEFLDEYKLKRTDFLSKSSLKDATFQ